MNIEIRRITPADALHLLEHNLNNRRVRKEVVSRYRSDMDAGLWRFAGDPIRIDKDGIVIDGQHRLLALSQSSHLEGFDFVVITGFEPDVQDVIDTGTRRTPADNLQIHGIRYALETAAAVSLVLQLKTGVLFRDNKLIQREITKVVITDWCIEHWEQLGRIHNYFSCFVGAGAPASICMAGAILFDEADPTLARQFWAKFKDRLCVPGDPIYALRKRFDSDAIAHVTMSRRDTLGLIITAWNATVTGQRLTKLQRPNGGTFRVETFPAVYWPTMAVSA